MHPCITDQPDITVLSQYLTVPQDEHYLCALKVVKYMYCTCNANHKVGDPIQFVTYVDANWGNDPEMH